MEQWGGLRRWGTAGPQAETERHSPALPVRLISFRVKNPASGGQVEARVPKGQTVIQPSLRSLNKQVLAHRRLHWLS